MQTPNAAVRNQALDPDQLVRLAVEMEKPLAEYLRWKEICERYHRGRDSKIAEVILNVWVPEKESVELRRIRALADPAWKKYLQDWNKAQESLVEAQIRYDNLKNQFEALQSRIAYERETIRRGL